MPAVITNPPSTGRSDARPNQMDGLAALYLACRKATAYVIFFWRLREIPRPPLGWFEAVRHVWHKPHTMSSQYELIIVWSRKPDFEPGRVWTVPVMSGHQQPLRLLRFIIDKYTKPGDTVLVPFADIGAIPLACQQLGRSFIAVEPDPDRVRLANSRLTTLQDFKDPPDAQQD